MLRQRDTRPLHWADKTMSVLRADQLEACEKDLAGLPSCCLFEPECSNIDAERLYDLSFFAEEDRRSSGRPLRPALGEVSEPLVGRQGSRVSMRVARGSASLPEPWEGNLASRRVEEGLSRSFSG